VRFSGVPVILNHEKSKALQKKWDALLEEYHVTEDPEWKDDRFWQVLKMGNREKMMETLEKSQEARRQKMIKEAGKDLVTINMKTAANFRQYSRERFEDKTVSNEARMEFVLHKKQLLDEEYYRTSYAKFHKRVLEKYEVELHFLFDLISL
jgi:hypothetical protein